MIDREKVNELREKITPQWLAGFFDGEGCVSPRHPKLPSVIASISQSNLELLTAISEYVGNGNIIECKRVSKPRANEKRHYQIQWSCRKAAAFLEIIKPYVIVKKQQVELAIVLASLANETCGRVPRDEEKINKRLEIAAEIKGLNNSPWSRRMTKVVDQGGIN